MDRGRQAGGVEALVRAGRAAWAIAGLVVAAWALVAGLRALAVVVVPLLLALFLAALLEPMSARLVRRGVPSRLAALLVVLGTVALVVGGLVAAGSGLGVRLGSLSVSLDIGVQQVRGLLDGLPVELPWLDAEAVTRRLQDLVGRFDPARRVLGLAPQLLDVLAATVLALIAAFFYLADGPRIGGFLLRLAPRPARADVGVIGTDVWAMLTAYVRGAVLIATIDAAAIGAGFAIAVGAPLAPAIGVVTFLTAFVPFVGAIAGGAVATLVALAIGGPTTALVVLAIVVVVQQVEGNVLAPLITGNAVAFHPLAVIVVVTAGGALLGLLGAVIAVPVAAAAHRAVTHTAHRYGW